MSKIGEDSPIPKFIYLKIRRRDGVESLTTPEEGEFKVPIDGCIRENVVVTCKIVSFQCLFLCSLDNLLQKNLIVFVFFKSNFKMALI